jgi:hypothetical protein
MMMTTSLDLLLCVEENNLRSRERNQVEEGKKIVKIKSYKSELKKEPRRR